jgi:hypothetical protein
MYKSKGYVEILTRCRNFDSTLNEVRNIHWESVQDGNIGRQCRPIASVRVQLVPEFRVCVISESRLPLRRDS